MGNSLGLSNAKYDILNTICATVKSRGLPMRVAIIVVETALVESELQIFANGNVPSSFNYPHTNVGYDHTSVGILQQQVPDFGWGNVQECMDVAHATNAFVDALLVEPWESQPNGVSAQQVQVSAFPDKYQARDGEATGYVSAVWGGASVSLAKTAPPEKEEKKDMFDIWQIVHGPTRGRQYAVSSGRIPVWMSPTDKATLQFFGWFTSMRVRGCEQVQIDRLGKAARKAG